MSDSFLLGEVPTLLREGQSDRSSMTFEEVMPQENRVARMTGFLG